MAVTVVELNDSEIRVARGTEIVLRSPGYAVVHNDTVELGESAVKLARLNPRAVYNRYWSNLNEDVLQHPSDHVRHHADLAYAHLLDIHEQVGKPDELLFAVPGNFTNQQLALLLGLVEASPIKKTVGLVDIAVATAAKIANTGEHVYLDLHLHHAILTEVSVSDFVTRGSVQVVDGAGLTAIYDASAAVIADLFIKQTRFDPQHHAETEQALYDQIPASLAALRSATEVPLEVQYQQTQYQTKLPAAVLLDALQPIFQKIVNAVPASSSCLIGDRLSVMPGFVEQFSVTRLVEPTSVMQGCQDHLLEIHSSGTGVEFITRLPAAAKPTAVAVSTDVPPVAAAKVAQTRITHLLHEFRAYPMNNGPLYVSATGGATQHKEQNSSCLVSVEQNRVLLRPENSSTVVLNGRALTGSSHVQAGDVLSFVDSKTEYKFISEVD